MPQAAQPLPSLITGTLRPAGRKARLLPHRTADAMDELMAVLPQMLGRRLHFHEPGAAQPSFDELWLANLLDAIRQGDGDRYRFALRSRMSREKAASLHYLLCRAARTLDQRPADAR